MPPVRLCVISSRSKLINCSDEPIWPAGTDRGYFLEKLLNVTSSFGNLAEKVLADKADEHDSYMVLADVMGLNRALPNFQDGYKAFVRENKLE
jgi:hypothetical protein